MVQPDAAPDNAADRRFGLSQFHIFVEQDMLGGTAFLCGVFHGNFSQLYVHAENVLDDLLFPVAGSSNRNRNGSADFQPAGTDGTAVGIGGAGTDLHLQVLSRAGQFYISGECHLLCHALQQRALRTAVQHANVCTQFVGDAVGSGSGIDNGRLDLTADDAKDVRIIVRQYVVQFNTLLLYFVQKNFSHREHFPIDFQVHMELLLFCRPAALAWAAPYRFCCGAAFALSYADKRGDRTASDSFLYIMPIKSL